VIDTAVGDLDLIARIGGTIHTLVETQGGTEGEVMIVNDTDQGEVLARVGQEASNAVEAEAGVQVAKEAEVRMFGDVITLFHHTTHRIDGALVQGGETILRLMIRALKIRNMQFVISGT